MDVPSRVVIRPSTSMTRPVAEPTAPDGGQTGPDPRRGSPRTAGTAFANDNEPVFDGQGGCPVFRHDDAGNEWITEVPNGGTNSGLTCKDGTWVSRRKAGATGIGQGAGATAGQAGVVRR